VLLFLLGLVLLLSVDERAGREVRVPLRSQLE
jgi:hypothetical protein